VPDKYVVVFDTNIFLQALVSRGGPSVRCLNYFEQGQISIAVSRATLAEIEDVLSRSHLCLKYPQLTDGRVEALLDRLLYRGIYLRQVRQHFTYPRDPKDEPQLNLAIEVESDYIISRDNDLLDLMNWQQEAGREFQRRFRFLKIVTPEEFLRVMEQPDVH
jgi:putative PIN family toxin of toxin-antitoxin system